MIFSKDSYYKGLRSYQIMGSLFAVIGLLCLVADMVGMVSGASIGLLIFGGISIATFWKGSQVKERSEENYQRFYALNPELEGSFEQFDQYATHISEKLFMAVYKHYLVSFSDGFRFVDLKEVRQIEYTIRVKRTAKSRIYYGELSIHRHSKLSTLTWTFPAYSSQIANELLLPLYKEINQKFPRIDLNFK